jgi:septum formation protein
MKEMTIYMYRIILASKSARRQELLGNLHIDFNVAAGDVNEDAPDGISPAELVCGLASRKLHAAAAEIGDADDALIIAADTVVKCGDEIFGKPADPADALRMIRAMSGHSHEVYTGIAVARGAALTVEYECTRVFFRELSEDEINNYIEKESVADKAGAYGIQEAAGLFVERIEGDYYNIVGLPLCRLGVILRRDFGVDLYRYMQK